jgi:hypothetical protein
MAGDGSIAGDGEATRPGWRSRGLVLKHPEYKLRIVKTLRLSEAWLRKIKAECTACDLRFSDFMRRCRSGSVEPQRGLSAIGRGLAKTRPNPKGAPGEARTAAHVVPFGTPAEG